MDIQATNTINNQTYAAYCSFRLPCGICTRTNSYCPITGNAISSPYTYSPTCTINSGTTNPGEESEQIYKAYDSKAVKTGIKAFTHPPKTEEGE